MNKRKKVAWHKHLKKARKQAEKKHEQGATAARPAVAAPRR